MTFDERCQKQIKQGFDKYEQMALDIGSNRLWGADLYRLADYLEYEAIANNDMHLRQLAVKKTTELEIYRNKILYGIEHA